MPGAVGRRICWRRRSARPGGGWTGCWASAAFPRTVRRGDNGWEQALEARRGGEEGEEFKAIRRGWCLGEETFRKELLAQMSGRMGAEHYGEERAETAVAKAEGIIAEELQRRR